MAINRLSFLPASNEIMPHMKRSGIRMSDYEQTISLQRLARKWHMPRRQVRRLVQKGKLPFVEIDGQIRVPIDKAIRPETTTEE